MRAYRKNRRPGNRKPNADEASRIVRAKEGPCMACLVWFEFEVLGDTFVVYGGEYNHVKSGNIRVGHAAGFNLCLWHHRGRGQEHTHQEGKDPRELRKVYGPSLMDGSRTFHATYGSDEELIQKQTDWLDAHSQR